MWIRCGILAFGTINQEEIPSMKLQRKDEIIRLAAENRVIKANELSELFQVSMETIRRDLTDLEKSGVIRRIHGGAVLNVANSIEPDYSYREIKNYEEKLLIGRRAASLVEDGETIIIDIGTTALEFARFLKDKKKITVLTNSLKIALELMDDADITVIILGGVVRYGEGTSSGFWAEDMVDRFYAEKLFLGVGALDARSGIMDYHIEETNLRRHYITHSKKVIAMADYSKFGIKALNEVCTPDRIDCLITDEKADKKILKELREQGIEIIVT